MLRVRSPRALLLALWLAVLIVAPGAQPEPHAHVERERIEVTTVGDHEAARALVVALGGEIEVESQRRIQALVTPEARAVLEASPALVRIERPGLMMPLQQPPPAQVVPALELIGVERWREAGFTGHRVKVAVVDTGFNGYETALGVTLPHQVVARSFRADGSILAGTDHGRRAAEIMFQVAPGAEMHLVNFSTVTELSAAVDYLIEAGIHVVSFSLGYIHNGRGDGTGPVNEIVTRATDAGIAWAVAAGNWAQQHWGGEFADTDGDSIHDFLPGVEENGHAFNAGDLITVSLRWDDTWGASCSDYDIELFGPDGSLVRASRAIQACHSDPVESMQVLATQTGTYQVRVVQARSDRPRRLSLMVVGAPDRGSALSISTPARSLSEPADNPNVIAVGALTFAAVRVEAAFSSRGPTTDGRTKPNLLAPTGAGPLIGQPFAGTSASAPHVAGVLALLREAFPGATRVQLHALAQARSVFVPPVETGTPGVRRVDTGTLTGVGVLLPVGGTEALAIGEVPEGTGIALLQYQGPDGYPLRFVHLLVGGRKVSSVFALDLAAQRFLIWIRGAPAFVNTLERIDNGAFILVRVEGDETPTE